LAAALQKKNPGFGGEVGVQPIDAHTMAVAINDRDLVDIDPLSRFRIGDFNLVLDLSRCDITDLGPLKGMPLVALFLEENRRLTDIAPLRGMRLMKLYLSHTRVRNLGPLRGAPLQELNLVGTRVDDVSPLSESPIRMLWLSECPIEDISPLKTTPLVSLTVENTPVDDISAFRGHPIQRLHIGGTEVSDLTPVRQMRLTRLIFTPAKIEKGLDDARNLPTLQQVGTTFDEMMPPPVFWQAYDAGKIK
jgi:Leucine-rich repeat (LRR) protein